MFNISSKSKPQKYVYICSNILIINPLSVYHGSWEPLVYKVSFDQCKFNITRAVTISNDKLSAIKLISICWLSILSSQLLKCDSFVVSLLHHGSKMNVYVKTGQQDI